MKKLLAVVLALSLCLMAMSAVAEGDSGMKLGLNVDTTMDASADADGEDNGVAEVSSVAVAVLVDADGKIADVDIDMITMQMPFTSEGLLGEEFPETGMTKRELGNDYGMSAVSQIGDWDVQIDALSQYLIGKTADEVSGVAMDESAKATDAELTAGCTMSIGGFLPSVVAAMEKAVPCGAQAGDKVGVGVVTATSNSMDAEDGEQGQAQAYSYFAAAAVNADGVITACKLDSTQGTVKFDATGVITSDVNERVATKQELGDDYGMRKASGIGKEWFEQADAFAAYVTGKTAAEVEGVAMDESAKATDAELSASVTVSIGDFRTVVLKAVGFAK